ncbi:hypothetical protein TNCV_1040321 [Trichonephila clavipes]|nr:hypothetical protein TNCV_1040321 [Trichonephila clavipes]
MSVIRMLDDNVVKKVLQFKVTGIRKRGKPRLRWVDSEESDFGIKSEKTLRALWKNLQRNTRGCLVRYQGCCSSVVKVPDHGRHVMGSILVPLKTHHEGERCTLNLWRAQTSSLWCGVVIRRRGWGDSLGVVLVI